MRVYTEPTFAELFSWICNFLFFKEWLISFLSEQVFLPSKKNNSISQAVVIIDKVKQNIASLKSPLERSIDEVLDVIKTNKIDTETISQMKYFNNIVIQGLGFVGAAMAVAVASRLNEKNEPIFNVTGIDLHKGKGQKRIDAINAGIFPFKTKDTKLNATLDLQW